MWVTNLASLIKIRRRNADNSEGSAVVNNWTARSANRIVISQGKLINFNFNIIFAASLNQRGMIRKRMRKVRNLY